MPLGLTPAPSPERHRPRPLPWMLPAPLNMGRAALLRATVTIVLGVVLTVAVAVVLSSEAAAQDAGPDVPVVSDVIFVDPRAVGSGSGDSWDDAMTNLPAALFSAVPGQEVWVARGRFVPGDSAELSFVVGVPVLGGFNGTEASPEERVLSADNRTILSGDIQGNDTGIGTGTRENTGDNAFHVVIMTEGGALDGVTVEGGAARGDDTSGFGGGIYSEAGNWTLRDVTLRENTSDQDGAGLFAEGADDVSLERVTFENNETTAHGGGAYFGGSYAITASELVVFGNTAGTGGGMSFHDEVRVEVVGCRVENNRAIGSAGGMNIASSAGGLAPSRVEDCTFVANSASGPGGGLGTEREIAGSTGPIDLVAATFRDNSTDSFGGGLYTFDAGTLRLEDVRFENNSAETAGGGAYLVDYRDVFIDDSWFVGNTSTTTGGLVLARSTDATFGTLTITNGNFERNLSYRGDGGAMSLSRFRQATISNSSFSGNSGGRGGALVVESFSTSDPKARLTVERTDFTANQARAAGGGAYLVADELRLAENTFSQNTARATGGALHLSSQDGEVVGHTFSDNLATLDGGALFATASNVATARLLLSDSTFARNRGTDGGGAFLATGAGTVSNITFEENSASGVAGGLLAEFEDDSSLSDLRFLSNSAITNDAAARVEVAASSRVDLEDFEVSQNTATLGVALTVAGGTMRCNRCAFRDNIGGAAQISTLGTAVDNALFVGNRSLGGIAGGLSLVGENANTTLRHLTFSGNRSADGPADLLLEVPAAQLVNSLIDDALLPSEPLVVGFSTLSILSTRMPISGVSGEVTLAGESPLAFPIGFADAEAGDFRLASDSPALDRGDSAADDGLTTDLAGSARITVAAPDLGAYERACNNRGVLVGDVCMCETGYSGTVCDRCDPSVVDCSGDCSGNGTIELDACVCDPTFDGDDCDVCLEGWTGASCDFCIPALADCSTFCNGNGRFVGTGTCECNERFDGDQCDRCELGFDGALCDSCATGFDGADCDRCAERFTGPDCSECEVGFAGAGCASCAEGFEGDDCERCAPGFSGRLCEPIAVADADPTGDMGQDLAEDLRDVGESDLTPDVRVDASTPDVGTDAVADTASDLGRDGDDVDLSTTDQSEEDRGTGVVTVGTVPTGSSDEDASGCAQSGSSRTSWVWLLALAGVALRPTLPRRRRR